ncbi:hypothetical protein CERSUDRAFT_103100 [Gelatoporia subvermispora B]|uniref:Mediator of RNA polymerase II transcription subunit 20 n=1 Tax=Ceriporiopsis subvermispora (strain B) TaxID=914234 RepID=M2QUH7_CERS8|nr:hypothetical protein CERSUDRAFT_103100 [Gelatoporia subvermispora B]
MGFTGLARWINAPTTGLELVHHNVTRNHQGHYVGKWQLSVKSFRSTLGSTPGFQVPAERSMCTLTMNENVFVLLEDPAAPTKADMQAMAEADPSAAAISPPHFRSTFLTLTPPGALEQILAQLKAKWVSVRQATAPSAGQKAATTGQQLTIDGHIYAIGHDWLVRAGNVILAGGAVKGMLLEAEYLPLPVMHTQTADGTSELLSNLLLSVLPNVPDAKTVAVTISDSQWEEVLWDREEEEEQAEAERNKAPVAEDDVYVSEGDVPKIRKGDWTGIDRDRRSAFLIMGALRSEGIL